MHAFVQRMGRFMAIPLGLRERGLLLAAAVLLAATFVFPLWNMTMFAPQYQDGLRLNIYSYKLGGGNGGQDVKEINLLNHYIGMQEIATEDFSEFKWMPFVIGALGLLFLRAAVQGRMSDLIDVVMLYFYFAAFALASFAYKMYSYGHVLRPGAPVKVPPFMPPIFGYKQLANFEVYSYPALASYALCAVGLVVLVAIWLAWRSGRPVAEQVAA